MRLLAVVTCLIAIAGARVAGAAVPNLDGPVVLYHNNGRVWIEATYDDGRIVGKWTEYYDNGQVYRTGETFGSANGLNRIDDPLRTGQWLHFYPDGTLQFEGFYRNNLLVGRAVQYHPNGQVRFEGTFDNGRLSGLWVEYWDNGQVRQIGEAYGSERGLNSLEAPLKTGHWTAYQQDGSVSLEGTYEENLLQGRAATYYPDGTLFSEGWFEHGQLTGAFVQYHPNGRVRAVGEVKGNVGGRPNLWNPVKTGYWVEYWSDGSLAFEGTYENGLLTGRALVYGLSGLEYEVTYHEGRLHGPWTRYHPNGEVWMTGEARHGESRPLNSAWEQPMRVGPWHEYNPDGTLMFEGTYVNGRLDGPAAKYHENGKLHVKGAFVDGQVVGEWTEYFPTGELAQTGWSSGSALSVNEIEDIIKTGYWRERNGRYLFEGAYQNGLRHGPFKVYDYTAIPGWLIFEGTYESGQLVGTWAEYYNNGQVYQTGQAAGSRPNSLDPTRTGLWLTYRRDGTLEDAAYYENGVLIRPVAATKDPFTGLDRVVIDNPDGSRTVYDVGPGGIAGVRKDALPNALPFDIDEVVDYAYDRDTGELRIVRKATDGSLITSTGRRWTDDLGNERISEVDERGVRRETLIQPDGAATITVVNPDGSVATVTLDLVDGFGVAETLSDGSSMSTLLDPWTGSLVTAKLDLEGLPLEVLVQRQDGWIDEFDTLGNMRMRRFDEDGSMTVIELDRSGNVVTTTLDPFGKVVARDEILVAPREPGRDYYENVLGGVAWDELSEAAKAEMARSEQKIREMELRDLQVAAEEARRKREEAERQAEALAAMEELELQLAAIRAEQEEADRRFAEWMAREERRRAIEESREKARELQRQYDAAVARGDMQEARRIMALQDAHHEASMELLMPTEWELREMERLADIRYRLVEEINEGALKRAQLDLFNAEREQDIKDSVTAWTGWVALGSELQQMTSASTRAAERQRIIARAQIDEIDSMLARGGWSNEERQILLERRELAVLQENGAVEMLEANGRITAAGYLFDGVSTVTGVGVLAGLGRAGTKVVVGAATRLGQRTVAEAAERAAARVAEIASVDVATPAVSALGSTMRRLVGDSVADVASSVGSRVWELGQSDVMDLTSKLTSTVRRAPEPASGSSLARASAPVPEAAPSAGSRPSGPGSGTGVTSPLPGGAGQPGVPRAASPDEIAAMLAQLSPEDRIAVARELAATFQAGGVPDVEAVVRRISGGSAPGSPLSPATGPASSSPVLPAPGGGGITSSLPGAGSQAPGVYRTPTERMSTVLENAPSTNPAMRTERVRSVSEMTPAERQAFMERTEAVDSWWGQRVSLNPDDLDDVLPVDPSSSSIGSILSRTYTPEEIARLHQPGRALTREELIRKAEIHRARHEAAYRAANAKTPAERLFYEDELRRINELLDPVDPWELRPRPRPWPPAPASPARPPGNLPPEVSGKTTILDRPLRPPEPGTEMYTVIDFPPVTSSSSRPSGAGAGTTEIFAPVEFPPLRAGAAPERPVIEWPEGPYIHGLPGPGIGPSHIRAARQVANETGVPIVLLGSRQTGIREATGRPWGVTSDLDIGVIGPPEALATVLRHGVEGRIPNVIHAPIGRWDSIYDALSRGFLVVSPAP